MPPGQRAVVWTFLGFIAALGSGGWAIRHGLPSQAAEASAYANIVSPVQEKLGTAKFFSADGGVKIELDIIQQVPGPHAVRILSVGKCEGPDFASAGPPFVPNDVTRGSKLHEGDVPNVEADLYGRLKATVVAKGVTLGDGPDSLFHPGGTAIVIDENAYDPKAGPGGHSGPHVACGVIQNGSDGASDSEFGKP